MVGNRDGCSVPHGAHEHAAAAEAILAYVAFCKVLELLLQLVTLDGSSSHLPIRTSRKQSSMLSWQTEDWR